MINIELWELLVTFISTLTVGGVISSIIALKWSKRKYESETKIQEETAKQEHHKTDQESHNADSIALQNAKLIIDAYKQGFEDLKGLYDESNKELEKRCNKLEEDLSRVQKITSENIDKLEKELNIYKKRIHELEEQANTTCGTCEFAADCKRRIALGTTAKRRSTITKDHE